MTENSVTSVSPEELKTFDDYIREAQQARTEVTDLCRQAALAYGRWALAVKAAINIGNQDGLPPGGGMYPHHQAAVRDVGRAITPFVDWPDNYSPILGFGYDRFVTIAPFVKEF
jgi:hypothetical protein